MANQNIPAIQVKESNVGIGTVSPTSKLEVYDSSNATSVKITSDGANEQLIIRRYSSTNEQLIFGVHSSDFSYIQAVEQGVALRPLNLNPYGGNIGIGTTSPTSVLTVNGNAHITGAGVPSSGAGMELSYNGGISYIGSFDRNNSLYRSLYFYSSDTIFENNGSERMRITSAGNVGIGTSNPYSRLSISNGNNTRTGLTLSDGDTASLMLFAGANAPASISFDTFGLRFVGGSTVGTDNGTEHMRITTLGKVGIGTTTPYTKLDVTDYTSFVSVSAAMPIESTTNNQAIAGIDFRKHYALAIGASIRQLQAGNTIAYPQAHLAFYTNDGSIGWNDPIERMRITSSGSVGIGTTNPTVKLEVSGQAFVDKFQYNQAIQISGGDLNDVTTAGFYAGSGLTNAPDNNGWYWVTVERHSDSGWVHQLATSYGAGNTENLMYSRVKMNNNTWTAWKKIAYSGDISGTTNYVSKFTSANTLGNSLLYDNGTSVGIGTTNPLSKLHVYNGYVIGGLTGSTGVPNPVGVTTQIAFEARSTSAGNDPSIAFHKEGIYTMYLQGQNSPRGLSIYAPPSEAAAGLFVQGNVGIGTTSPAAKLHISAGDSSYALFGPNVAYGGSLRVGAGPATPSNTIAQVVASDGNLHLDSGTGQLTYINYYSETNTLINPNAGNVGIGTYSPQARLDVNGGDGTPAGNQFAAVIKGADSGNRTLYFDGATQASVWWGSGNTPQFAIDSISGGGANFWTNNGTDWSERMRIQTNGDIGINTTSPSFKLDVNGWFGALRIYPYNTNNTYIDGDGSGLRVIGNGYLYVPATGGSYFEGPMRLRNSLSNDANSYLQINGGTANLTYFAGTIGVGSTSIFHSATITSAGKLFLANTNNSDIGGAIYGYWDSGYQAYAGGLVFQSFNINGGGSYTMKDAMVLTGAGNLAVGTSYTYGNKLSVSGGVSGTPSWNNATLELRSEGGLTTALSFHRAGYTSATIYSDDGSIVIGVGGERVRVATSGNVGIGTSAPQKPLDAVSGANNFVTVGAATAMAVGQWSGIHFGYREDNSFYRKSAIVFERTDLTEGNAQGKVHILNGPQAGGFSATLSDSKLTIAENGNVGIGTTSPSDKLTILGSAATTFQGGGIYNSYTYGNADKAESRFNLGKIEGSTYQPMGSIGAFPVNNTDSANGILSFYTRTSQSVTEKMRITDGGNVGIGTTSPGAKLEIIGDLRLYKNGSDSLASSGLYIGNAANNRAYNLQQNSSGDSLNLWAYGGSSWANTVTFKADGNVGIGTTTPPGNATNRAVEIVGSDSANVVVTQPGAASAAFTSYGSTAYIGTSSNHPFYLYTNNSERIRVTEAGNVGVGTTAPDPSALLDVTSRRQGFLPPRMRYGDMMSIPSPAPGLIVFDVDNSKLTVYTGTSWVPLH
jgi:hypothetical protein